MTSIWVTGAGGFIGSHLVAYLKSRGHAVAVIGGRAGRGEPRTGSEMLSMQSLDRLAALAGPPTVVHHLAGGSSVGASLADPHGDFKRTVASSAALLEWLRLNAPDAGLVAASSAAVYGGGHDGPIPPTAALNPFSPYGFHKRVMELLGTSYAHGFGLPVAIVRLFSVYGGGLRKQLLWDLCRKLATDGRAVLGGTGDELRDWTEVGDVVRFLDLAAERVSDSAPVFNGATGKATSVREIARYVTDAFNLSADAVRFSGAQRPGDPFALVALPDPAFQPSVSVAQGIAAYVAWYRAVEL